MADESRGLMVMISRSQSECSPRRFGVRSSARLTFSSYHLYFPIFFPLSGLNGGEVELFVIKVSDLFFDRSGLGDIGSEFCAKGNIALL